MFILYWSETTGYKKLQEINVKTYCMLWKMVGSNMKHKYSNLKVMGQKTQKNMCMVYEMFAFIKLLS